MVALRNARKELRAADRAFKGMRGAASFAEFEDQWSAFLGALERIWVKAERECRDFRDHFEPWQRPYSAARKSDELLSYLHHARNASNHTIQEIAQHQGTDVVITANPEGPWEPMRNVIIYAEGFGTVETRGAVPVVQLVERIGLLPVEDRGVSYNTPTSHLGNALARRDPLTIAELGLRYYADFLNGIEKTFP